MKPLRAICFFLAAAVFLGSGGYLLNDYMMAEKDRRALEELSEMVVRESDPAPTATEAEQGPVISLQVIKRDSLPQDEGFAAADTNDTGALTDAVQDYLRHSSLSESPLTEIIRLEITPASPAESPPSDATNNDQGNDPDNDQSTPPCVKVTVDSGAGSSLSKKMQAEIGQVVAECIASDPSWQAQCEVIDLGICIEPARILPQYEALYEQNPDIVGWISIEGTNVNYPVMQTPEDPEFYLRNNFEKEYSYSGLPFLDSRCDVARPVDNLLIYGHNMKNGTMFGQIPKYESKSFWKEHKTIQFDLLTEKRTYEVIGAFRSRQLSENEEGFRYHDYIDLSSMYRYDAFVAEVREHSFLAADLTADWGEQLLTLSTCSYHADKGTFVVVAKRTS